MEVFRTDYQKFFEHISFVLKQSFQGVLHQLKVVRWKFLCARSRLNTGWAEDGLNEPDGS